MNCEVKGEERERERPQPAAAAVGGSFQKLFFY